MKLCGRIDADQALLRYQHLLRAGKHKIPTGKRAKTSSIIADGAVKNYWSRRLADATR